MNDDHGNGPQIKLLLGELDAVWGRFERNLSTKEEQLKVAVEFQEMMSEVGDLLCMHLVALLYLPNSLYLILHFLHVVWSCFSF